MREWPKSPRWMKFAVAAFSLAVLAALYLSLSHVPLQIQEIPLPLRSTPSVSTLSRGPASADGESFEAIDRVLAEMRSANIAFNAPETMNLETTTTIQLLLSMSETIEELTQKLTAQGKKEGVEIKVSDRMEARLTGIAFRIEPPAPIEQAISRQEPTEWRWQVKPLERGKQTLHLSLTAKFSVNGHETQRSIQTFDKTITVEVTTGQKLRDFVNNNWQWLWATILVPAVGWLLTKKRRRNR